MSKEIKEDFPMLRKAEKPLIYLDSAATALKPQRVIDKMSAFYEKSYATVHRAIYDLSIASSKMYHAARQKAAEFINARDSREIIFTSGTTAAINLVAFSFGEAFIKERDEIIITEMEHHSNIVPWQLLCNRKGAKLKVAQINNNGELDLSHFQKLLNRKTKLVAITHVSNVLGTVNPIKKIVELSKAHKAYVLVDGAQAAPHVEIDVREMEVDFYAFSGHKIYGPTAIGVLYGKEKLLEIMPPYQGGGDMIEHVSFTRTTYNALPYKFEAGTPPFVEAIGLGEAIDYLASIGVEKRVRHEQDLLEYASDKLMAIRGLEIVGKAPQKKSILSFTIKGLHHLDIGSMLSLQNICVRTGHHCAEPLHKKLRIPGTIRISLAIYNTREDIDIFTESLVTIIKKLR